MWKSPVYFHTLFIPGEGVIVHLYWATMYAWSNALDKYVKNFDFIVMLWESCTRHCSYYNFDRGTGAQEMSKGLSAHYSEILEYSCVMCEPVVYRTTGSHWQASAASMLSCLLTSCGFLSRVNFIIGRIGHWKGFSLNAEEWGSSGAYGAGTANQTCRFGVEVMRTESHIISKKVGLGILFWLFSFWSEDFQRSWIRGKTPCPFGF